ncbi:MAG: hypothetical protein MJZ57_08770 [Bacteroidales bacterium]|nr:hypothetical protein [Bacteroidales bacterium]
MASFESLYNKIEYNVKAALLRLSELSNENEQLRRQNEELEEKQHALQQQLIDTEEKMKLLVITKTVLDKKDKIETKQQINDWVREIDYCIKLLSNK